MCVHVVQGGLCACSVGGGCSAGARGCKQANVVKNIGTTSSLQLLLAKET
jgi:hypothetical protein